MMINSALWHRFSIAKALFTFACFVLTLSLQGQNGSRTWTGAVDNDFYNGGNWDASGDFPNGNATFSGSTNTSIARTSNTYTYLYGLFFKNTLGTDSAFTIGTDNTETQINLGGNIISTDAVTDGGSLTDVINVNIALVGGNATQWAKEFRINTGHNLTVNGNITGGNVTDYTFTKLGDGTLTLGGSNSFVIPVTVSAGTLELTNKDALGNGGASIGAGAETTVNSGATLKLNYSNASVASSENLIINGSGVAGTGAIHSINSDHAGKITLGSDATINVETRLDHHGTAVIDGTGTLTKTGTGSLVRSGDMTVDNFIVEEGEYLMTGDSALITGDGTNAKATTIKNGGKVSMWKGFSITNTPDIIMEAGSIFAVTSNSADQTTSMNGKFTLNGDATFQNWSHDHTVSADITGTGGLTLISVVSNQDFAKYTFSGNNDYSGNTVVGSGGAAVGKMTLLVGSNTGLSANSSTEVTANSTLVLNGFSNSVGDISGAGTVENASATAATLTAGGKNTSSTFSGILQDGTGGGALSLTKTGNGTLTLSGTSTYTGTTTISGGILAINGNQGSASGAVTVASGGTLSGSGTIGGDTTVQSGGILAAGNSPGVLTIDGNLTLDAGSSTVMEITGTTRGTEYDGIDVSGALTYGGTLTITSDTTITIGTYDLFAINGTESGDFGSIVLTGTAYSNNSFLQSGDSWTAVVGGQNYSFSQVTGDLTVAVPEPGTYALFVGVFSLAYLIYRRR